MSIMFVNTSLILKHLYTNTYEVTLSNRLNMCVYLVNKWWEKWRSYNHQLVQQWAWITAKSYLIHVGDGIVAWSRSICYYNIHASYWAYKWGSNHYLWADIIHTSVTLLVVVKEKEAWQWRHFLFQHEPLIPLIMAPPTLKIMNSLVICKRT